MAYQISSNKKLRIAISGKSGCGNTTVSTLLAKELDIALINYTFRQLAAEKGMTLEEVMQNAKTDNSYDIAIDTHQVKLAEEKSCVLGSRLAIWMLKNADLKVYLLASEETRCNRIFEREGGDLQKIKAFTAMRDAEDTSRYKKIYQINNDDFSFADLQIDTAKNNPAQIVNIIIKELLDRKLIIDNE